MCVGVGKLPPVQESVARGSVSGKINRLLDPRLALEAAYASRRAGGAGSEASHTFELTAQVGACIGVAESNRHAGCCSVQAGWVAVVLASGVLAVHMHA